MANKKYLFLSLIALLICGVVVFLIFSSVNFIKPEESSVKVDIIWEKVSPDSQCKAVMFSKEADATVGVRYHLSVVPVDEVITEDDNANVFMNYGIYDIEWQDESTLLVKKYEEGTDYYKVEEYNGIKIKYLSPAETREYEKSKRGETE